MKTDRRKYFYKNKDAAWWANKLGISRASISIRMKSKNISFKEAVLMGGKQTKTTPEDRRIHEGKDVKWWADKLDLSFKGLEGRMTTKGLTLAEAVAIGGRKISKPGQAKVKVKVKKFKSTPIKPEQKVHKNGAPNITLDDYKNLNNPRGVSVSKARCATRKRMHSTLDKIEMSKLNDWLEVA